MSRARRLLDLLQALRRHRRPVTAAVLGDELGVSLRTLYRDIAALQGQGVTVEGEAGVGYTLKPGTFLPPMMFENAEVEALVVGLRFVMARTDDELAGAAADALAKIEAMLPPSRAALRSTSGLLVSPGEPARSKLFAVLRKAMEGEHRLRLDYGDKDGQVTARVVWPVAIGFVRDTEVLAAWCELRDDFRHFRLDRIKAVAPTGDRFPRRHPVLLAEWRSAQELDELF